MFLSIQLDLTQIGRLVREDPELAKKVQFADGMHQLMTVTIGDKKQPDRYGYHLNAKVMLPKDASAEQKADKKYFVGKGKDLMAQQPQQPQAQPNTHSSSTDEPELPF